MDPSELERLLAAHLSASHATEDWISAKAEAVAADRSAKDFRAGGRRAIPVARGMDAAKLEDLFAAHSSHRSANELCLEAHATATTARTLVVGGARRVEEWLLRHGCVDLPCHMEDLEAQVDNLHTLSDHALGQPPEELALVDQLLATHRALLEQVRVGDAHAVSQTHISINLLHVRFRSPSRSGSTALLCSHSVGLFLKVCVDTASSRHYSAPPLPPPSVEPPLAEQAEAEVEAPLAEVKAEALLAEAKALVYDDINIDLPTAMAEAKAEAEAKVEPPLAEQAEAEVEAHMAEVKAEAPMAEATGMVLDNFIIDKPMAEAAIHHGAFTEAIRPLLYNSTQSWLREALCNVALYSYLKFMIV